jgi:hypothetical protein
MGSLPLIVGMAAFLAGLIGSRALHDWGMKQLDDSQKLALLESYSGQRALRLIPLAAMVMLYIGASQLTTLSRSALTGVFWIGVVLYVFITVGLNAGRVLRLDLPSGYNRAWLAAQALSLVGVLALMACLGFTSLI